MTVVRLDGGDALILAPCSRAFLKPLTLVAGVMPSNCCEV